MNITFNNISKSAIAFASTSKWNDAVVSNFDSGERQLYGDMEV